MRAPGLVRYSNEELPLIRDFLRSSREFLMEHLERVKTLPATPTEFLRGRRKKPSRQENARGVSVPNLDVPTHDIGDAVGVHQCEDLRK